jgi:hypothetical protein
MSTALAVQPKIFQVCDPRQTGAPRPFTIVIDPEFESLIAPLSTEERAQLKANIVDEDGLSHVREPLIVWDNHTLLSDGTVAYILLDGHTRLSILAEAVADAHKRGNERMKIWAPCNIEDTERIPDRAAALLWIEENQVGRRNLTDDQRAVIWDSIRERRSAIASQEGAAKARAAKDADSDSAKSTETAEPTAKRDTRKEVAKESGLPESKFRTVSNLKKTNPGAVADVRAGKKTLRAAVKESKPLAPSEPAPAEPLTVQQLMDWFNTHYDDTLANVIIEGYKKRQHRTLHGKVYVRFDWIEPADAKALIEAYQRIVAAKGEAA